MNYEKKVALPDRAYINVMESLVAQEVGKQLQDVPTRVRRYLKMEEVVTYALNRLPTLYASSEKGWQYQRQLARRDLHRQIHNAVRQAIVAVQVDPLRLSQPLKLGQNQESEAVLQALRDLFKTPDLSWDQALGKISGLQQDARSLPVPNQPSQPWQPGSQSDKVAWTHRHRRPQPSPAEPAKESEANPSETTAWGWDDPRYRV